jgi:hypothetical protein
MPPTIGGSSESLHFAALGRSPYHRALQSRLVGASAPVLMLARFYFGTAANDKGTLATVSVTSAHSRS